jgi:TDG/mug DNA glycosylase family protein
MSTLGSRPRARAERSVVTDVTDPGLCLLLARLHRGDGPGTRATLRLSTPAEVEPEAAAALLRSRLTAAGFDAVRIRQDGRGRRLHASARRALTLPEWIGPRLRVLFCGLNPSPYAAEAGIPFGRPGNRFWPAARKAGLITRDRDVPDAVRRGIGFTDLVKRPTARAAEIRASEYERGIAELRRRVEEFRPGVVCLVGLEGWRRGMSRRATAGWLEDRVGGRPTYLMPSTSGLNARTRLPELVSHLRQLTRGGRYPRGRPGARPA